MAWAWWLAIPVLATLAAAVATWWPAHRARVASRQPDTDASMQAHRDYLDALALPARGTHRVGSADGAASAAAGTERTHNRGR
jgi:hypothetical protein